MLGRDPLRRPRPVLAQGGDRQGQPERRARRASPVVDEAGVIGQVTRVASARSPRSRCSPTRTRRSRCRSCATACAPSPSAPARAACSSCASWPSNAEIQNGDRLVTSGIDGTYPPGTAGRRRWRASSATRRTRSREIVVPAGRRRRAHRYVLVLAERAAPGAAAGRSRRAGRQAAAAGSASRAGRRRGAVMRALSDSPLPQHILLPVARASSSARSRSRCSLNFLPWQDVALVPDFVALVLVFWCVHQPRLVGLGAAWLLGLLMDVGNGVLLGQHALAYSVLAFAAISAARRASCGSRSGGRRCTCRAAAVRPGRRGARCAWPRAPSFPAGRSSSGRSSAPRSGRWSTTLLLLPQRRPARDRREPARSELMRLAELRNHETRAAFLPAAPRRRRRRGAGRLRAAARRASSSCRSCSTTTTTPRPRTTASRSCRSCPTAA